MNHLDHYLPHVGSPFAIRNPGGVGITLTLQAARDVGSTATQEQFALLFQGPAAYPLAQATYELTHAALVSTCSSWSRWNGTRMASATRRSSIA